VNRRVGGPVVGLVVLFVMWWAQQLTVFSTTVLGFGLVLVAFFIDPWLRDQFRRSTGVTVAEKEPAPPRRTAPRPAPVATRRDAGPARPRVRSGGGSLLDGWVLGGFVLLGVTVLVPWLIGRFLLRDSIVLERNPDVFDLSVRAGGSYFLADYLSGLLVPGVFAVAFLLLRPWVRRTGYVAVGFVLAGLLLVTLVGARSVWTAREAASAEMLRNGAFPFHERVESTCFGEDDFRAVIDGRNYSVGVHQSEHDDMFISYCNRIDVYQGWTLAGQVDLEDNSSILKAFSIGGDTAGDAWFSALVSTSPSPGTPRYLMGLSMRRPESRWRLDLSTIGVAADPSYPPEAVRIGAVTAVDDQLDYYRHRLLGVDMRNGQVLWTLQCPADYSSSEFVRIDTDPPDTMRMRCGRGGIGSLDEFLFGDNGSLGPAS
jgi:hypothetical protein